SWVLGGAATALALAAVTGRPGREGGWVNYLHLVRGGAQTKGVVVRTERQNHCFIEYTFNVDGSTFVGRDSDCRAEVGQALSVTYLIANPSLSCLGPARAKLENELVAFLLAAIIAPPFIFFAIRRYIQQGVA